MVDWIRDTVWWHVYPLGFFDAEKNSLPLDAPANPRLRSFEPWLDYLTDLGCNGILLAPLFSSDSHGYDTTDFYNLDSRLGTNTDLIWLIERCRERNFRVVFDGVFNHVGRSFGPFQDVKLHRQGSRFASWFLIDWNNTHNEDGFSYANFEGHHRLVKLNHHNPEVVDYIVNVINHWLGFGISGWRLDAAYAVPASFWAQVLDRVREKFPDAWILGEIIHGDYSQSVRQGHLESVTQYELWKSIWSALNDRNFFELSHALNRNNDFNNVFLPNIFLGNHDVTRIATELKDDRDVELALAVLCTIPGTPSIYYGDEQLWKARKEKRPGGDDAIRPAFASNPQQLVGNPSTYDRYRELLWLRRNNAWIASARVKMITLTNQTLVYETKFESDKIMVALNVSESDFIVHSSADLSLIAGPAKLAANGWAVPTHSWAILR
ncbi:alpha-amylase family protein [soil metagenome]